MFELNALFLARVQFAFTISFHIIFPALSIGLAAYLALVNGLWLRTRNPVYLDIFSFLVKPFALCFGLGVVSGVVMAYQFGTHWRGLSEFAGSVMGPLLTYEVLSAFFLEAGFLGVMIFGRDRVGPKLHFFATLMVALGTLMSTFWILASNSWMHTPQGHLIEEGRVIPLDWWQIIFNPSFPYRLSHMTLAAFLSSAFFIAALAAWQLKRQPQPAHTAAKKMFSMALWLIVVLAPLQVLVGDLHGLNTLKHQPAKIAAMEGHWDPEPNGSSLILFGWPDMQAEKTHFQVAIPKLGSLILHHDLHTPTPALKEFAPEDRPNATVVFWSFRIMVGIGLLMLASAAWSLWLRRNRQLYEKKSFLNWMQLMGASGVIALLAGWFTTEVGRQPWVIYGILRTKDAVSPHSFSYMSFSLISFVVVYCLIFGSGFYYLFRLARIPLPEEVAHD